MQETLKSSWISFDGLEIDILKKTVNKSVSGFCIIWATGHHMIAKYNPQKLRNLNLKP